MARTWRVFVAGTPATKGSLKCVGRNGRHQLIEDDKPGTRKQWRARVAEAARGILPKTGAPLVGPVAVHARFIVNRPASAPRSRTQPVTRSSGDIDKLARLVLDAITDAGLWGDDSQCCELAAVKNFPTTAYPDLGVHLTISQVPR